MLDVCLLGTSGMMPLPKRWLTALMTRLNGSSLLIDCGEGTQIAIREKGWSFHDIDTICFTHYHGDHISGLPGLLLSMGNADRTEPVTLIGPKGLERVVNALRVIAPELPFELKFKEITEPYQCIQINGYEIEAFRVKHTVTCYGYTLHVRRGGKFILEQAKQRNIPQKLWGRLQKGETILTEDGIDRAQEIIGCKDLFDINNQYAHDLLNALKAKELFIKDTDYVVKDGEIMIVDEFTGRLMPGRRWSDGLHQAIEAKEGVEIQDETQTLASITFQNLFRLYPKLSGMTGTAMTEAAEFGITVTSRL